MLGQKYKSRESLGEPVKEKTRPLRISESAFDPEVDAFLTLLGGTSSDKLKGFIRDITKLDKPSPALWLKSPPGYGKTILARGLSRLWSTEGPTSAADGFKTFNSAITECPLVVIDETVPPGFRKTVASGELGEFIRSTSFVINRQYEKPTQLEGCIRLMITTNAMLNIPVEDLIFVDCDNPEVKTYLAASDTAARSFIQDDRVAKHALWLRESL